MAIQYSGCSRTVNARPASVRLCRTALASTVTCGKSSDHAMGIDCRTACSRDRSAAKPGFDATADTASVWKVSARAGAPPRAAATSARDNICIRFMDQFSLNERHTV